MDRIRVGFVGAGGIVLAEHGPRLRAIPGVELVAVANRTPGSGRAAAHVLGVDRVHPRWEDLIGDTEVDLVVVGAWPDLHAPVTIAALEAGKHVLCEARMAFDLPAATAMLEASRAHPAQVLQIAPAAFSLWVDATITRLLDQGAIGHLRTMRIAWSGGVYGSDPWRRLKVHSGVNTMALGILLESLARWVGQPVAATAVATIAEPYLVDAAGHATEVDVPDHLVAVLELASGALATVDISATPRPEPNSVRLWGTDGTLEVDLGVQGCWLVTSAGVRRRVTVPARDRGEWRVEQDCVDAIRGVASVTLTDPETAWRYMAVTQAVVDATATGSRQVVARVPG